MFKDEVIIHVQAGKGGSGCVGFRREMFIAKGGPDGGNGGNGGSIIIRVNPHLNTLYHLAHNQKISAQNGAPGEGNNRIGKNGTDTVVEVPIGTILRQLKESDLLPSMVGCNSLRSNSRSIVRDNENRAIIKDLKDPGDEIVIAKGGRGGRGNKVFATAINQTPRCADEGADGQARWLYMELKLIADVGLVGLPNAGKSTLLASLSDARPKIANYPFTTLEPMLGVVAISEYYSFVLADLPGLIEGASNGKGLGDKFLRHIERTRLIVHILDAATQPLDTAYKTIRKELKLYSPKLARKPELVVINKVDLPGAIQNIAKYKAKLPRNYIAISALKRSNLDALRKTIARKLATLK